MVGGDAWDERKVAGGGTWACEKRVGNPNESNQRTTETVGEGGVGSNVAEERGELDMEVRERKFKREERGDERKS